VSIHFIYLVSCDVEMTSFFFTQYGPDELMLSLCKQ
jgi:hypothetical protein